jgi:hypothetical protein
MFYNVHSASQTRTWDSYRLGLPNIESNQMSRLEQNNLEYIKRKRNETTIEKGLEMKTAIEQSQISPTESLDSVGSLPLSSIDNSNSETIDDNEAPNLR